MARHELKDSDYAFNASLDPFAVLKRMGFTDQSIYQEGNIVRIHCPIHKDLVRKSMIIDVSERTFKCQYSQCEAYEGGLLIELVAMYYDCPIEEVTRNLFGEEDQSSDLLFRGEMYINKGQHQEALPFLEQAVAQEPRNEISRAKLAALYLELGRKDDAYREYMNAAESYAVRGELEKTLSIYNILIILQPGAVKARKELAYLFARMGRPDAAADQLKWVVDYYIQHHQVRGAQEAINSIAELGGDSGMNQFLLARTHVETGSLPHALQAFERAVTMLLDDGELNRADAALKEGLAIAPGNPALKSLRDRLRKLRETRTPDEAARDDEPEDEQDFMDWLKDVDDQLSMVLPAPVPSPVARQATSSPVENITSAEEEVLHPITETSEISVEDRRVALCLNDIRAMTPDQLEQMRQQLISMFTDVRKTHGEGLLSDWEMRTIKEFYKAFCMAVDQHRRAAN